LTEGYACVRIGIDGPLILSVKEGIQMMGRLKAVGMALAFTFVSGMAFGANPPKIGDPMPEIVLLDVNYDGHCLKCESKEKKAVVVIFIATRCPVSNAYNSRMVRIAKEYSGKGIAFYGINSNETEPVDEVAKHAKENGFPFVVLKDYRSKVADKLDAQATPEAYVFAPEKGKMVLVYHGRIDDSQDESKVKSQDLRDALEAVLKGKRPERPETRAFGCSIKRPPKGELK
jgi:peroxiredoxin